MKNKIKFFAIIAIVALIMVGIAACADATWTLKVVNSSSHTLNVKMMIELGSASWNGDLQAGESNTITGGPIGIGDSDAHSYNISYRIPSASFNEKSGQIESNKTVTVTITDADL